MGQTCSASERPCGPCPIPPCAVDWLAGQGLGVWGLGFRVTGLEVRVSGSGRRVQGVFGFCDLCFVSQGTYFGFRVPSSRFQIRSQVLGLEEKGSRVGIRVSGFVLQI